MIVANRGWIYSSVVAGSLFVAASVTHAQSKGRTQRPEDSTSGKSFIEAQSEIPTPQASRYELPVNWQLTRTRLIGASSSTVTESYRELWALSVQGNGIYQLQSPRARVPVFAAAPTDATGVPTSLTMSETDFGLLIGVKRSDAEMASVSGIERPITVSLVRKKKPDSDILLTWGEDQHYSVQLDFSPAVLY